jgi:hypothetical protein
MSADRKHFINLNPRNKDEVPLNVVSWRIQDGWMVITEEDSGNASRQTLIPPTWPTPIGITTFYEEQE